uniref:Cohesin loading complex subunit SCC4 homolog n=1 Tax=Syphacia muris TaxID=451379 RepID=A0A0N5AVW1_9BILA
MDINCPQTSVQHGLEYGTTFLAMAEHFRTMNPPKYKMAIKCVRACFQTRISAEVAALAHFALGKLCFFYTKNVDLAKCHLEQAYNQIKGFGDLFVERRLEVACLLSEVYMELRMYDAVKRLLREESMHSRMFPMLHARILFLYAEAFVLVNDWRSAEEVINVGGTIFSQLGNNELECYFNLTSSMIISMDLTRGDELMQKIMKVGEKITGLGETHPSLDYVKAFCFTVQICFFLSVGLMKSTKVCLRQLQALVQQMKGTYDSNVSQYPLFDWMGKETLTALTYVLTVIQSVQTCQLERAYKYHAIAMRHIGEMKRLMAQQNWPLVRRGAIDCLNALEIVLLQNFASAQLMLARPFETINVLNVMVEKMRENGYLYERFKAQAHALIGIYCWLIRLPDDADRHFQSALRATQDTEFWTVVNLCLAIVYLITCRESDFYTIFERITPGKLQSSSPLLKSSAHFVHALHSYLHSRFQEARSHLTDSVTIVRDEGVPRIQALATLLSAKLAGVEAPDILVAANDWAAKSSDQSLMLWSNHMICDLQTRFGNLEQAQIIKSGIQQVETCIMQSTRDAMNSDAHRLIKVFLILLRLVLL